MKNFIKTIIFLLIILISVVIYNNVYATDDYVEIWTIEDLVNINNNLTGNYILMKDIDLTEATAENGWTPIGNGNAFKGVFDGNNHSIIGMNIKNISSESLGLFCSNSGTIKNLNMIECIIEYKYNVAYNNVQKSIGTICGTNSGKIENCNTNSDISVTATNYNENQYYLNYVHLYIGGIAGKNDGTIRNCSNNGRIFSQVNSVSSMSTQRKSVINAGGIVGKNNKDIELCYNVGEIVVNNGFNRFSRNEQNYTMGVFGINVNDGNVTNSYNAGKLTCKKFEYDGTTDSNGKIINYYNCGTENGEENYYYYDSNGCKSIQNQEQMKLEATYKTFDFENVWTIDKFTNYEYPQLITNRQEVHKHSYEMNVTKATFSQNGVIEEKCSECGEEKAPVIIYYPKTISIEKDSYNYDGKAKKPTVKLIGENGEIISEDNYTVSYENNVNIGNATVIITGKTNYTGTVTKEFKITPVIPFTDVPTNSYYYTAVNYCYANKIILGTSTTKFTPGTLLSRANLVTILWRMEGSPIVNIENKFPDIKGNEYFANAIKWASSKKIVNGYSDGKFKPNSNVTREQLAVILCNYAQYKGKNINTTTSIEKYDDYKKVSSYAVQAVQWAVKNGIINGAIIDNKTVLNPQGNATRSQIAVMIYNYCTRLK